MNSLYVDSVAYISQEPIHTWFFSSGITSYISESKPISLEATLVKMNIPFKHFAVVAFCTCLVLSTAAPVHSVADLSEPPLLSSENAKAWLKASATEGTNLKAGEGKVGLAIYIPMDDRAMEPEEYAQKRSFKSKRSKDKFDLTPMVDERFAEIEQIQRDPHALSRQSTGPRMPSLMRERLERNRRPY